MATDPEVAELVTSLKKLMVTFTPYIQEAGSVEQAEEAIRHMEEQDGNFHRYDYVKRLRSKIDGALGALIDEEIEKHSIGPNDATAGQETVVSQITQRVLQSTEFQSLTEHLQAKITATCDHLLQNFDSEFAPEGSTKSTLGRPKRRNTDVIFSEDEDSSFFDSSLNPFSSQSDMFMNNEHFQKIAEKLDKRKPLEIRQEAVTKLLQVTSMDSQNSDVWAPITQGLHDALSDSDEKLWTSSLKFVAKSLSANNTGTKDLYLTLVEFLTMQFNSMNKGNIPILQNGLDLRKAENIKLFKGFRLMNDFQQEIPQYWIRYPEKFVDDLVDSTLSLLSTYTRTPSQHVSPGHFVALLDPHASWFRRWMHGHYSRGSLMKHLDRHKSVVESAVRTCLHFIMSQKMKGRDNFPTKTTAGDGRRLTYTEQELNLIHFVHCLCFLGRLLCYHQGRMFFPIKVRDREEPVSVVKLVVSLIQLVTSSCCTSVPPRGPAGEFEPFRLVTDVIKRLSASETVCRLCLCKDEVTDTLLDPISYWLDGPAASGSGGPSDASMLYVADIMSTMAANDCGRRHLLYGETGNRFTKSKSAPVHVLSEFVSKAISGTLGSEYSRHPSLAVVGSILFVCRQLYSCCEGLQITYSYDLHSAIAVAWKVACQEADRAATPTPSSDGQEYWGSTANIVLWEDMLKDNLLNFSWTPKGLLLLQQAGAINECISYMFSRYMRKLQVSKYEKFGYGYMMSQVAAITPGVSPLQQAGFLNTLLRSLWSSLEIVEDRVVHTPRTWPIIPIDKNVRKTFTNLANVLSSYCAVSAVLGGVALPTKDSYSFREMPESIAALLDRLVFIDTPAKVHSLFNYEQSHVFGLRLMSILTSCLDSFLLIQTQYNLLGVLMEAQKENCLEDSSEIIVDMLSVERNYLLVKNQMIGGPSERNLPPRTLSEAKPVVFGFPLFCSFPVPKEYVVNISSKAHAKQESDLSKFLSSARTSDNHAQWLERGRKHFCSLLTSKPDAARGPVLQDLLEKGTSALATISEEAIFPLLEYTGTEVALKNVKLTPIQKLGVDTALRYGAHLKLISNNSETKEKLMTLLKKTSLFLKQQQRSSTDSPQRLPQSQTIGYDWFLSSVFILFQGDSERVWKFLHKFSALAASAYLWGNRLHGSVHLPPALMTSGIPVVFSNTCHHIEYLLQVEMSHVYTAFKMSGYSPAQICQHWIRQCFWNYLDWQEICHYLCVCVSLGIDYQVYVCVAILRYKQRQILNNFQDKNLLVYLKEEPLTGFKIGEHLEYMQQLQNKYRKTVLSDMLYVSRP